MFRRSILLPMSVLAAALLFLTACGGGAGGELVVRELLNNPDLERMPVGFVDDDRTKHRTRIHGLPVFGGGEELERVIREQRVE